MKIYYKEDGVDFGWYDYSSSDENPNCRSYCQVDGNVGEWNYSYGMVFGEKEISKEEFDELLREWELKYN